MRRENLTEKLLDIKRDQGWNWAHICEAIGGASPVLITAAVLGQMRFTKAQCSSAIKLFDLSEAEGRMLMEPPYRGTFTAPPTDPLVYRFYELVNVFGTSWKELIQEEFGDGIMSAIDFDFAMERQPDIKGDRVKITMSGKFLPYRYYGSSGNNPENGLKES